MFSYKIYIQNFNIYDEIMVRCVMVHCQYHQSKIVLLIEWTILII